MSTQRTISSLNGDLSRRVVIDSNLHEWRASPSGTVWRKRLHRVGAAESGQVTSLVRYEPNASFPAHDHPEGEEILVLEGTFSDEHGDWPAGSYLLNPEGFRHAPFSREGCLIFVKLRQYSGDGREHVALDTSAAQWSSKSDKGIATQALYADDRFPDAMRLERWSPGSESGPRTWPGGVEILVIEGRLADENGTYAAGTWLRLPDGASHRPRSPDGCLLYIKAGAVSSLHSAR
ncbi:MAG: cupin domain-containing protein [Myxococcota bacterium]